MKYLLFLIALINHGVTEEERGEFISTATISYSYQLVLTNGSYLAARQRGSIFNFYFHSRSSVKALWFRFNIPLRNQHCKAVWKGQIVTIKNRFIQFLCYLVTGEKEIKEMVHWASCIKPVFAPSVGDSSIFQRIKANKTTWEFTSQMNKQKNFISVRQN